MKHILSIILFSIFLFFGLSNIVIGQNNKLFPDNCTLTIASCNVSISNSNLDSLTKDNIDFLLQKYYQSNVLKYKDLRVLEYLYFNMLEQIKEVSKQGNIYDYRTRLIGYLYSNIEVEYYKVIYYKNIQNQQKNQIQQNNIGTNNILNTSQNTQNIVLIPEKNTTIQSFNTAKRVLERDIYNNIILSQNTLYCGCNYTNTKDVIYDNSCSYKNDGRFEVRSKKIEWEHIVPAENFGNSFIEWRDGHKDCIDSKGNQFKGRNCAEKINMEYRYMQADLYNLAPAIGSINAKRSNYSMAEISGKGQNDFGSCDIKIEDRKIEPRKEVKGMIARVYMYMDITYPNRGIIGNQNKKLFEAWDKMYPITNEECIRYKKIREIQGNDNIILKERCEIL